MLTAYICLQLGFDGVCLLRCVSTARLVQQRSIGPPSKPLNWEDVLSLPLPSSKEMSHTKRDMDERRPR